MLDNTRENTLALEMNNIRGYVYFKYWRNHRDDLKCCRQSYMAETIAMIVNTEKFQNLICWMLEHEHMSTL